MPMELPVSIFVSGFSSRRLQSTGEIWNAMSTPPVSSSTVREEASRMKRMVMLSNAGFSPQYCSKPVSSILSPLTHSLNIMGPVPTGARPNASAPMVS